jgi:dihydropteroate synthase
VHGFFRWRIQACEAGGISVDKIVLDPGFGFAKTQEQNLSLFKHLDGLHMLGRPLMVGVSRKSMIGAVLGREANDRLSGSLALAALATTCGVGILRVHDVAETLDVVRMVRAVMAAR